MKNIKVHIIDKLSDVGIREFNFGDDIYTKCDTIDEATAVIVRSSSLHDKEFDKRLCAIARAGAGVNNIPIDKASKEGIVVFNTPGANANSVKELVVFSLLLGSRDIYDGINWVKTLDKEGIEKTVEKGKKAFVGHEIKNKTLGVIGLGAIGIEVANVAISLGMKVIGYDPYLSVSSAFKLSSSVKPVNDLNELLKNSDYISIHIPLTKDNEKLLNKNKLDNIKDGAVLLNFSRDILVDEEYLLKLLEHGKIKKYITDFPNSNSVSMKNTIAIPHLGASTKESEDNCARMAVCQLKDYIENGNIINSVNYPNCDMGVCTYEGRIAILHKNIPNMLGQISALLGNYGINIADLTNKSRNEVAYTMIDIEQSATDDLIKELSKINGILRVRVIK